MDHKYRLRQWRKLNTVFIITSMIMSWYYRPFVFDNFDPNYFSTGNPFTSYFQLDWAWLIQLGIDEWHTYQLCGCSSIEIVNVLLGISGLLLPLYLVYNLLVLTNKIRGHRNRILISITLIIMAFLFFSSCSYFKPLFGFDFTFYDLDPQLGLWLVILSLVSSAALELTSAKYIDKNVSANK